MNAVKYLFHSTTICRIPTYILSSHRRYLAWDAKMEANNTIKVEPEMGPSPPELQVNHLTGDHEHIIEIALNRPDRRNALGKELIFQLDATLESLAENKTVRCILFRSLVPNVFCAGADLKERLLMSQEDVGPFVSKIKEVVSKIFGLPVPTIAALDGLALGGGLELTLACDIRIAAETAKLGLTETKLGIIPGAGGTQRLPRLIGLAKAKELIYTGRILDGQQAYDIRLVNEVVKQNEQSNAAYKRSLEIAREIVQQGPLAVRMAKQAINKGMDVDLQTGLDVEDGCYGTVLTSEDRIEGLKAFQEKRKPIYKDIMVGYDPKKKDLTNSQILIASTTSSFIARFLLQPIDVIKIRFQLQIEPIRRQTGSKYQSLIQTIRLIHHEESIRAFWKGHVAAQILSISYNVAQMYAFEKVTKQVAEFFPITTSSPTAKTITHFITGSIAASVAVVICQPMDVLRTRFVGQGEPKIYTSYIQAINVVLTHEGYHGFYRGLVPGIILYAPVSALLFGFYELFNRAWERLPLTQNDAIKHVFNGGAAGLLAKFAVYPFDLTKKRLEVVSFEEARSKFGQTRNYSSMRNCFSEIIRTEGIIGLYKGIAPSLIKAYLSTAITLSVYDSVCTQLRKNSSD